MDNHITPISVLSLGLNDYLGEVKLDNSFERQISLGRHLLKYHVISRTKVSRSHFSLAYDNSIFYSMYAANRYEYFVGSIKIASSIIRNNKIDCIVCDDPTYTGLPALWISKKYHLPICMAVRNGTIGNKNFVHQAPLKNTILDFSNYNLLKYANLIRVSTWHEYYNLTEIFGDKVRYSNFYVDPAPYLEKGDTDVEKLKRKLSVDNSKFIIFCAARLEKQKGIDIALMAIREIASQKPDVLFLLAGVGTEEAYLKKLTVKLEIEDKVKFLGGIPYEMIHTYFKMCDLYIMTSYYEGTCMSLLQAAFAAKPIVSTCFAGAKDLLEDHSRLSLCEISNYLEVAQKVIFFIKNPRVGFLQGAVLMKKVLTDFSPDLSISRRLKIWSELTNVPTKW